MHRQQLGRLLLQPTGGLLFLATRAMTITTASPDPMLSAATVTLVQDSAKFPGSATGDRTEYLAVTGRYRVAKRLKIARCVLPKTVRNRGHRLTFRPPEDLLDRLPRIRLGRFGQVQVDQRRLQTAVAHVLLDRFEAHSGFE